MNGALIFGGWAVSPEILKTSFGNDAHYVDVNKIMPELFDGGGELKSRWADMILPLCRSINKNISETPITVIGWSTGAMFAYALARIRPPQKLLLLSATPSFCRRADFEPGVRPAIVDRMIAALGEDRRAVLKSFYGRCGLAYDDTAVRDYTTDELSCGLRFLMQTDLRPLSPLPPSTGIIFHHGKNDVIIPPAASYYFHKQVGGARQLHDGGHSFFLDQAAP